MRNLAFLLFLGAAFTLNSCKKSTSSPSITGTWAISGISGTTTAQATPSAKQFLTTYAYASPILTLTDTTSNVLITVTYENWEFNSDGTYSIKEQYQAANASAPTVHSSSGWWDYTGSTLPNSTIVLRNGGSTTVVPIGGSLFIKSVTSTQLVLTAQDTNTSTTGSSSSNDFTLTFTRQ